MTHQMHGNMNDVLGQARRGLGLGRLACEEIRANGQQIVAKKFGGLNILYKHTHTHTHTQLALLA